MSLTSVYPLKYVCPAQPLCDNVLCESDKTHIGQSSQDYQNSFLITTSDFQISLVWQSFKQGERSVFLRKAAPLRSSRGWGKKKAFLHQSAGKDRQQEPNGQFSTHLQRYF